MGGGGWWVLKVNLVIDFGLSQAEQNLPLDSSQNLTYIKNGIKFVNHKHPYSERGVFIQLLSFS